VSDGKQLWLYYPSQNTVWTGTIDQLKQLQNGQAPALDSPQALVQQLLSLTTVTLVGTESVQGHSAYKLQFAPKAGQAPQAAMGATGLLWIDQSSSLPLQASINAGSMGQGTVAVPTLQLNTGIPDDRFHFQIPPGAKTASIQDRLPQHTTLGDAQKTAGFPILQPSFLPQKSALVDVLKIGTAIVLRYETGNGSLAVAEGVSAQNGAPSIPAQSIPVRGTTGKLYTDKASNRVLLVWTESGRTFSVSGVLSGQDAVKVADSLK
jgi:hypothetical protein